MKGMEAYQLGLPTRRPRDEYQLTLDILFLFGIQIIELASLRRTDFAQYAAREINSRSPF